MRVLYLTMNPNRASTTVPTEGWFLQLRPKGLRPVLVSDQVGAFHNWAVEQGIPAYRVPLPFPSNKWPLPYLRSLWSLHRIVKRHQVELIHCNEQSIYPIGKALARWHRVPVAVSVHSRMDIGFGLWAFRGLRCPDRMYFLSHGSRKVCHPAIEGSVPDDVIRLLYNGIDLNRYRPDREVGLRFREEHRLGQTILIGAITWLRPGKQIEHLMEIAHRIDMPGVRLVLAGGVAPGEEAYAAHVLEWGRQLLGDRFIYLGCLSDVTGICNALDLYINTSKEETCSISIIEALACGCPVVGYPSISVGEQVGQEAGETVEQDRTDLLAQAVRNWLSHPQRLAAARSSARARAVDTFDIGRLAQQLWSDYHELVPHRTVEVAPRVC